LELSGKEFLSIIQDPNPKFARFDIFQEGQRDRMLSDGIRIDYTEYSCLFWGTYWTAYHFMNTDSIQNFYNNAAFSLTNLKILDDCNIIAEGEFSLNMHSNYSPVCKNFSLGYFKGYARNIYGRRCN
jgi:hypothetical protein